ncbi:glycosyltransferase [Pseudorhodobacter ferrugineus]|uniref:glycosyltransferase n=1 Tax=Pseudorhodobacter ferrugineus TaxID=77008 RepID=UPI0018CDCD36|nr:glycosyltransferase [Pseudorhodobacter ferrugineus]
MPVALRRSLRRQMRRFGMGPAISGCLEGVCGVEVTGWVTAAPRDRGGLPVGLFAADVLLAETKADEYRGDVRNAGFGDGGSGYRFALTGKVIEAAGLAEGRLTVRLLDGTQTVLGDVILSASLATPLEDTTLTDLQSCRIVLSSELASLAASLRLMPAFEAEAATTEEPRLDKHDVMFATTGILPEHSEDILRPSGQSAYLDFTAYRFRLNEGFDRFQEHEDLDKYLSWYIETYRMKSPWRIPLGKTELDRLNGFVTMPGLSPSFTRAMWWRLSAQPKLMGSLCQEQVPWYIYWWCISEAPSLGFEDCLIPPHFVELMQAIPPVRQLDGFALCNFTEQYLSGHKPFHFLDRTKADHRRLLVLCLMLIAAAGRAHIMRYLPTAQVDALLKLRNGVSDLERFAAAILPTDDAPPLPALTPERFAGLLRLQGYDLAARAFLTVTPHGDRFHAAAMPVPAGPPTVDVQMIGPFQKASGLGQASRLSQTIMEQTGYSVNAVDFGMDNPAPEGFSQVGELSAYKRARVNLIQLNAESIPLAFAYQPDVFSGAYNIAYVYWELDTPALCHYLGMMMIDEIWVAAEYGVKIYKPHMDKPVTNVGMCYEDVGDVDRTRARAFVNRRCRLKGDEFIFLVAFDSFSFVQRKNPVAVLEAFRKAFPDRPDVRLVVKTQNRNSVADPQQLKIWRQVDAMMAQDSRIKLINETLSYEDLLLLKKGSDCYISLHKSEGWGFGMIEAMGIGVPVVCTGYSANMDFCSDETAWLVDHVEARLGPQDYIFVRKDQHWAEPDVDHAALQLRAVYDNPGERVRRAEAALRNVRQNFSSHAIAQRFKTRLDAVFKGLSEP